MLELPPKPPLPAEPAVPPLPLPAIPPPESPPEPAVPAPPAPALVAELEVGVDPAVPPVAVPPAPAVLPVVLVAAFVVEVDASSSEPHATTKQAAAKAIEENRMARL
jgi:hypothetical protein